MTYTERIKAAGWEITSAEAPDRPDCIVVKARKLGYGECFKYRRLRRSSELGYAIESAAFALWTLITERYPQFGPTPEIELAAAVLYEKALWRNPISLVANPPSWDQLAAADQARFIERARISRVTVKTVEPGPRKPADPPPSPERRSADRAVK